MSAVYPAIERLRNLNRRRSIFAVHDMHPPSLIAFYTARVSTIS